VTLNHLERRNGRYFALLHRNRDIWGQCVTVAEVTHTVCDVEPKFHYTDTDQTGPDPTRPDPTRHILRPGLRQDWYISNSTIRARPDRRRQIGDLSRDVARPINPTINPTSFNMMENVTMSRGKNIVAACTAAIAFLGAASLLAIGRKRRQSTWVKKYTVAENSMENVTLCYRNLQLLKW